jgi:hypothetical protein
VRRLSRGLLWTQCECGEVSFLFHGDDEEHKLR